MLVVMLLCLWILSCNGIPYLGKREVVSSFFLLLFMECCDLFPVPLGGTNTVDAMFCDCCSFWSRGY